MARSSNHKYLCCTSLLFGVSILYFFYMRKEKDARNLFGEQILATLLVPTILLSQLFWINPVKYSFVHKIDAIIAKIVIILFIFYTLLYKFKHSFLLVLFGIFGSFYFSNYFSTLEWCCDSHLLCHAFMHVLCFVATLYTFS